MGRTSLGSCQGYDQSTKWVSGREREAESRHSDAGVEKSELQSTSTYSFVECRDTVQQRDRCLAAGLDSTITASRQSLFSPGQALRVPGC